MNEKLVKNCVMNDKFVNNIVMNVNKIDPKVIWIYSNFKLVSETNYGPTAPIYWIDSWMRITVVIDRNSKQRSNLGDIVLGTTL